LLLQGCFQRLRRRKVFPLPAVPGQLVIAAASSVQIALIVILVAVIERGVGIARITRAR
jgi:hypothetical protein